MKTHPSSPPYLNRLFSILLLTGSICLLLPDLAMAQHAGGPAEAVKSKNLLELFHEGGWIMWVMLAISIWCMALLIECSIKIRLPNFVPAEQLGQLKAAFQEENFQQAWRICKGKASFLTNVLRHGLERVGRGRGPCEAALSEAVVRESMVFRTKISYLSTIGVVSPMVGLLGTVTGMIKAFQTLGAGGIGDPSKLAAAIGEVLIATASGLGIAIPAFFLYYFFRNRLQTVVIFAEDSINQLMMDVKYDEIQGIKIGEAMESEMSGGARAGAGRASPPAKGASQQVAGGMACPQCNGPITVGAPKCPSCGTALQWS